VTVKRANAVSAALAVLGLTLALSAAAAPSTTSYWDPDWSPDGRQIAFVGRGGSPGDLFVMNADGTGLRQLTHSSYAGQNYGARQPAWSPDGKRIVFGYGYSGMSVINVDGTGLRPFLTKPELVFGAAWSPRGKKIAFAGGGELNGMSIYVVNPDGTHRTLVARRPSNSYSYVGPTWSPDGQRMAFTIGPAPDTGNRDTSLGLISRYRGKVTRIARGHYPVDADWSPKGGQIVFSDWGSFEPRLALLSLATRKVRALGPGWHPRWSPDGRSIAFARAGRIWVMNADGSGARALSPKP
jgi:Tol biopolymer transport system component